MNDVLMNDKWNGGAMRQGRIQEAKGAMPPQTADKFFTHLVSLVLCCAWLVTMALHVHCGLGQFSPLPTSGDDE